MTRVLGRSSWLATTFLFTALGFGCLAGVAVVRFGSVAGALKTLRGDALVPDVDPLSMGRIEQGSERAAEVFISNGSMGPIRLLGARGSCTCVVAENLPTTIPPGGTTPLRIVARPRANQSSINEVIQVYTDSPDQPQLVLRVSGDVLPSPPGDVSRETTP